MPDYLALFLQSRGALGLSSNTIIWYKQHLTRFAVWLDEGGATVQTLTPLQFQAFLAGQRDQGYSPSTVAQSYQAVRAMFRWMVDTELIASDPTRKQKSPKVPDSLPRVVSREYICHLLETIPHHNWVDERDRCMLELLFITGLRVGEVRSLLLADVDLTERNLHVIGKGKKDRIVFFSENFKTRLWQWMYTYRPPCDHLYLFLSSYPNLKVRGQLGHQSVYNMLSNRVSAAAMDWRSPHAYRHGHAVDMLKNGLTTREVQILLGHHSVEVTERYLRLAPALIQGRLDELWDKHPLW